MRIMARRAGWCPCVQTSQVGACLRGLTMRLGSVLQKLSMRPCSPKMHSPWCKHAWTFGGPWEPCRRGQGGPCAGPSHGSSARFACSMSKVVDMYRVVHPRRKPNQAVDPATHLVSQQAITCTGNPPYQELVERVSAAAAAAAEHPGVSVGELAALPGCAASDARYPFVQTALALREARVPRAALGTLAAEALGVRPGSSLLLGQGMSASRNRAAATADVCPAPAG